MKKCLLFGILVILLSFVVVLGESCTDSDGGKNYYVKGKVIADVILGSGLAEDTCVSEIKLREMFCNENGEGEPYLYTCPNGCEDGACIIEEICENECGYIGEKICGIHHISLGGLVMTCGNYDDDECLEWQGKYCGEGYKCVDGQCIVCHGCLLENECLPYGIRMESNNVPSYCDIDKTIKPQKEMEETCQNDYECKTNDCSDGRCVSTYNLLERIWDLLKRIFRF